MNAYRDGLEAATHRIDSLEERVAEHEERLETLNQAVEQRDEQLRKLREKFDGAPTSRSKHRSIWTVALMVGVLLAAAFVMQRCRSARRGNGSDASSASSNREAAPGPAVDSSNLMLADPADLPGARSDDEAADVEPNGDSSNRQLRDDKRLAIVESLKRKSELLVKLAGGYAEDSDLDELNKMCVLDGDVPCRKVVNQAMSSRP